MHQHHKFADRREAGRALGKKLAGMSLDDPVVLALPRGGVPVGFEVAEALGAPLEPMLVRKIGAPQNPEFAIGAVASDGQIILDQGAIRSLGVDRRDVTRAVLAEQAELMDRRELYIGKRGCIPLSGRTAILVDDGVATGSTAVAAARALRGRGAGRVILGAPVGPFGIDRALTGDFDEVVCLKQPRSFGSVGHWYDDFDQVTDDEALALLAAARLDAEDEPVFESVARIDAGETVIGADLRVPIDAVGLVVFAHGSGSSRHSPRNRAVAMRLNAAGFATLLVDLLTEDEMASRDNVFDVDLLASRLVTATDWARAHPQTEGLRVGYFGASTGAAAAIVAAAEAGEEIGAVVCRGGRPDLAGSRIRAVVAPTLMIVGGVDLRVLELNEIAASRMSATHRVAVVPGATHLFEERGALERVGDLAYDWFAEHLATAGSNSSESRLSAR